MIKEYIDEDDSIQMLLDINHFFGDHESRLGPKLICVVLALAPALIYVYYGLFYLIPVGIFMPIFLFWAIRVIMKTIGQESKRLEEYKKQLYDRWSTMYSLMRIKRIYQAMVEYLSGSISYFIIAYNGDNSDNKMHAKMFDAFVSSCVDNNDINYYIQNITYTETLENRYKTVSLFGDRDAIRDVVDMIDYNSHIVRENSVMQRIIIQIKGYKSDWKTLRAAIDSAIYSDAAKAFKEVHLVTDPEELDEIFSMDLDGVIQVNEVVKKKYCTGNYYGSRVLCYDDDTDTARKNQKRKVVAKPTAATNYKQGNFHVIYKEE